MDLVEVRWGDGDWIGLAQDRDRWRAVLNSVLNLRVQQNAGKLSSVQATRDLSSSAQLHRVSYVNEGFVVGTQRNSVKNLMAFHHVLIFMQ
jgi:hypothetical protein